MSTFNHEQFESEAGTIVLESAILKFVSTTTVDEQEQFTLYIEQHEKSPTLIDDLQTRFPRFGEILTEELKTMQEDARSLADTN